MAHRRWRTALLFGLGWAALCSNLGAAQGNDAANDPGTPPIVAASPVPEVDEAALAARLNATLQSTLSFDEVAATVENGVVTLTGFVTTREASERLEQLTQTFPEVRYTENEVVIRPAASVGSLGTRLSSYRQRVVALLPSLLVASLIFGLFWLASLGLSRWRWLYRSLRINPLMKDILRQLLRSLMLVLGAILALELLGASAIIGALLGTAGIVGIALGFAFRDIIENYLAGILLSFRQPFDVNDLVRVEGVEGRVVRLTSRELVLMTLDGNHVRLPNSLVFKSTLTNFTRNPRRRFDFVVGVDVSEDLKDVQRRLAAALAAMPGVLAEPAPRSQIEGLGDSNIPIRVFGWVDQREADFGKVRSEAIRLVKLALDEAGVQMPEPIHNVRIKQVTRFAEGALAPEPKAPVALDASQLALELGSVEVAPDDAISEQVAEDLRRDDENLLKPKAGGD